MHVLAGQICQIQVAVLFFLCKQNCQSTTKYKYNNMCQDGHFGGGFFPGREIVYGAGLGEFHLWGFCPTFILSSFFNSRERLES